MSVVVVVVIELVLVGFEFVKGVVISVYVMGCFVVVMVWNTATAVYDRMSDLEKFLLDMIDSFFIFLGDLKLFLGKVFVVGGEVFVEMNVNNFVGC